MSFVRHFSVILVIFLSQNPSMLGFRKCNLLKLTPGGGNDLRHLKRDTFVHISF